VIAPEPGEPGEAAGEAPQLGSLHGDPRRHRERRVPGRRLEDHQRQERHAQVERDVASGRELEQGLTDGVGGAREALGADGRVAAAPRDVRLEPRQAAELAGDAPVGDERRGVVAPGAPAARVARQRRPAHHHVAMAAEAHDDRFGARHARGARRLAGHDVARVPELDLRRGERARRAEQRQVERDGVLELAVAPSEHAQLDGALERARGVGGGAVGARVALEGLGLGGEPIEDGPLDVATLGADGPGVDEAERGGGGGGEAPHPRLLTSVA
jgi:hypothetical protein